MSSAIRKSKVRPENVSPSTKPTNQALQLERLMGKWAQSTGLENHIRSITVYPPSRSRNGQWLIVAKAWSGGYKLVAFHRATDPLTAMLGFFQRATEGKLIWKEDSFSEEGNHPKKLLGGGHD